MKMGFSAKAVDDYELMQMLKQRKKMTERRYGKFTAALGQAISKVIYAATEEGIPDNVSGFKEMVCKRLDADGSRSLVVGHLASLALLLSAGMAISDSDGSPDLQGEEC